MKEGSIRVSRFGDRHHDAAIPILLMGGARGSPPRSKVSTTIMRPPQWGHGWARAGGSVSSAVSSASGGGMASSSRARAMLRVRPPLAKRPPDQVRDRLRGEYGGIRMGARG